MIDIKKILIILLFLLIGSINGYVIENSTFICKILPNNLINETINLTIYNNENELIKEFSILIPQNLGNITINSSNGIEGLEIKYYEASTKIMVKLNKPVEPDKKVIISYNGIVYNAIWGYTNKQLVLNIPIISKITNIKIILPPGAVILSDEKNLYITPGGYVIKTDGRHQIIEWTIKDNKNYILTINVKYSFVSFPKSGTIENISQLTNNSQINLKYIIIIGILLLVSISSISFLFVEFSKRKKYKKEIKSLKKSLEEKEKNNINLMELIEKLKNECEEYKNYLIEKEEYIKDLSEKIAKYEAKITELTEKISNQNIEISKLRELNSFLSKENEKLKYEISELKKKLDELKDYKKGILWQFLTDDEKRIIELIKEHGSITQKEICEITNMSKPKVSRIVTELEDRKIIKKEKIGRINKLRLTEESEELL